MFIETAFAQAAAAPPAGPSFIENLLPMILVFGVVYFLMIRPQLNQKKEHDSFVSDLKKGQQVLTSGGVLGTIEGITEQFVTLEIAEEVRIKVLKKQVFKYAVESPAK